MKKILVLGAGRSSSACISYLLNKAPGNDWEITVGDFVESSAMARIGASNAKAISFDIEDTEKSRASIGRADVVISLIPAAFHPLVAKLCLLENKHLITASYVSDEMRAFDADARAKGLLFLNECGLDPGIDHMSAMQVIDKIKTGGGRLVSFESFTGGLIAADTDPDNPWRYKFTWNPRNVVLAGQGTAKYLQDGKFKYISYQQLFTRTTPILVPGVGEYDGYANRDSLKYVEAYGLRDCQTVIRGTLRNKWYCSAWNILAQLGCCDDSYQMENVKLMSHNDFILSFLASGDNSEEAICRCFNISAHGEEMRRLRWTGLFTNEKVGLEKGTPAQVLEHILNKKWQLRPADNDFIVMWHRFKYQFEGKEKEIQAWLTAKGEGANQTAMAKTVGLPLAIACRLLLEGRFQDRGVVIPTQKEIYEPILGELKSLEIGLKESPS